MCRVTLCPLNYFFAAFLTAALGAADLTATALDATGFAAALATGFMEGAFLAALGATFFASTTFLAGAASAFGAFFLTAFDAVAGAALDGGVFLDPLPPKIPCQPSEYFSFVPTRVIVTKSPSNQN